MKHSLDWICKIELLCLHPFPFSHTHTVWLVCVCCWVWGGGGSQHLGQRSWVRPLLSEKQMVAKLKAPPCQVREDVGLRGAGTVSSASKMHGISPQTQMLRSVISLSVNWWLFWSGKGIFWPTLRASQELCSRPREGLDLHSPRRVAHQTAHSTPGFY